MKPFAQDWAWTGFGIGLAGVGIVLLLVLMMANPVCTLGFPWTPFIRSGAIVSTAPSDLYVTVSREGYAAVGGAAITKPAELQAAIASALAQRHARRVLVQADVRTKYGALMPIFAAARDARVPVVFVSGPTSVAAQTTS